VLGCELVEVGPSVLVSISRQLSSRHFEPLSRHIPSGLATTATLQSFNSTEIIVISHQFGPAHHTMVVLPRHARRRFGNPYGNAGDPNPPPHGSHTAGGHYGPSFSSASSPSSSRILNQQSILLLLAGMGLGYLVAISIGGNPNTNVSLDAIVKKLEQQREVVPNDIALSSPTNMMHSQHRDAAAAMLLRGDSSSALYSRRRASGSGAKDIDASVNGATIYSDMEEPEADHGGEQLLVRKNSDTLSLPAVHNKKHTFREQEDVSDDLSDAQQRFVETQKLLGSQSIPTPTNPHVMKTVS
jgi:hypothetical protein